MKCYERCLCTTCTENDSCNRGCNMCGRLKAVRFIIVRGKCADYKPDAEARRVQAVAAAARAAAREAAKETARKRLAAKEAAVGRMTMSNDIAKACAALQGGDDNADTNRNS